MNMYNWIERTIYNPTKKAFPLMSYPAVQLMYITVKELIENPAWMAMGMRLIADKYDMPAATSYMDLSVEAEAFGAHCVYGADEIPSIIGRLVSTEEEADALRVPEVGEGRTGICIDAIKKSLRLINDRPVFANCTGPFSLTGRLMDINEVMLMCYEEPEVVHKVLRKATDFIKKYILEFKKAGANGVILAEPLAGILSPALIAEFSSAYVREIVDEIQEQNFIIIYHNCGNSVLQLVKEILDTGCHVFHFGDHADIRKMLEAMPSDKLIMGNISPTTVFNCDSPRQVRLSTQRLLFDCMNFKNFLISSGCDIPPDTDFDNIDAFFDTVNSNYYKRMLYETMM